IPDDEEKADCSNPGANFEIDAGVDIFVDRSAAVELDGSIEGMGETPPIFNWTLVHGPDVVDEFGDSVRQLSGRRPVLEAPDAVSTLVWELEVTVDGISQYDTVTIQVQKDRQRAIYVGSIAGTEGDPDGSLDAPYSTLQEALLNLAEGEDIYVQTAEVPYPLINALEVPDGTSLFGGYDENWVR